MGNFWKALKNGVKAAANSSGPGPYAIEDIVVSCTHCENQEFAEGSAQLNTAGMTFIGMDWANKSAHTLMCTHCGHIEWFMQRPTRL